MSTLYWVIDEKSINHQYDAMEQEIIFIPNFAKFKSNYDQNLIESHQTPPCERQLKFHTDLIMTVYFKLVSLKSSDIIGHYSKRTLK